MITILITQICALCLYFCEQENIIKLGLEPDLATIRAPTRLDEFTSLLNFHLIIKCVLCD
jgi:hypothetical protein